jgi:hypothetical protein
MANRFMVGNVLRMGPPQSLSGWGLQEQADIEDCRSGGGRLIQAPQSARNQR